MANARASHPAREDFAESPGAGDCAQGAAARCHFCAGPITRDVIDAGGDVGTVHRTCFLEWDRLQEVLEVSLGRHVLPDPGEFRTERELEVEQAADRAA